MTEGNHSGLELLSRLEQAGAITITGLHLSKPDLTYSEAEALCFMLGKLHEAVRFAIGDMIILAEKLFGEDAYQLIEAMNLSEDARREYVRVSERVARSTRRKDLSWSHHRAVAALKPLEQKRWLRRASQENLSHHGLREALREGTPPAQPKACRCCGRSYDP